MSALWYGSAIQMIELAMKTATAPIRTGSHRSPRVPLRCSISCAVPACRTPFPRTGSSVKPHPVYREPKGRGEGRGVGVDRTGRGQPETGIVSRISSTSPYLTISRSSSQRFRSQSAWIFSLVCPVASA